MVLCGLAGRAGLAGETGGPSLEDALSGFEEETETFTGDKTLTVNEDGDGSPWDVGGTLKLSTVCNINHEAPESGETDHRGLSRLRTELTLSVDRDLGPSWECRLNGRAFYDFAYTIRGREEYTGEVLDTYENEAEIQEAYIRGSILPSLDLKAGRQILVWGRSETFRVTDVLNPLDYRTPGLVDIENLRLPVTMIRLDYYLGNISISGIAIPEIRFHKLPVVGHDFYPADYTTKEVIPEENAGNTEWGLEVKGIFHNWDASLYAAGFFDDLFYVKSLGYYEYRQVDEIRLSGGGVQPVYEQTPATELRHPRLFMGGMAANAAWGSWIFKTEVAFTSGHRFTLVEEEKDKWKFLFGVEYSGLKKTRLYLDFMETRINGFEPAMASTPNYARKEQFEAALHISRTFRRERLELTFTAMIRGEEGEDGALERISVSYDFTDRFTGKVGAIFYQDGQDPPYHNIHENNRLYLDLTCSF
ncbi:MAG: DUF1302 domain-containing protein [Desulfosudaceae bacterium]